MIGGGIILTIPYEWQRLFNESDFDIKERMHVPVQTEIVEKLYHRFPDFRRAFDIDGMTVDEFDDFGATVRTQRSFIGGLYDLVAVIRDFMLPNPDTK